MQRNKDTTVWLKINAILGVLFSLCFIALLIIEYKRRLVAM